MFEQHLSLELYRLFGEGHPVQRAGLAQRLESSVEQVNETLATWPGVFSDQQGRVVGYWGLSIPRAYASPHRITIGSSSLSAWCAWDTLFLPELVGQTAEVESASPRGGTVRVTVTPTRIERVDPVGTFVSFLLPDETGILKDVLSTFCHFIHFFPTEAAGHSWVTQHPGTFLLSIEDAHDVGRRRNRAMYFDALS